MADAAQYTLFEELDQLEELVHGENEDEESVYKDQTDSDLTILDHVKETSEETRSSAVKECDLSSNSDDFSHLKNDESRIETQQCTIDQAEECKMQEVEKSGEKDCVEKSTSVQVSLIKQLDLLNNEMDVEDASVDPSGLEQKESHILVVINETEEMDSITDPVLSDDKITTYDVSLDNLPEAATSGYPQLNNDVNDESHLLTELERQQHERTKKGVPKGPIKNKKKMKTKSMIIARQGSFPNTESENNEEEPNFIWENYLEETNSIAAPPTAFTHVEKSLENGFKESMVIEVLHDAVKRHYWYAKILMTCGPLLSLRYLENGNDKGKDFWCDTNVQEVHPVGWSKANQCQVVPPSDIIKECENWEEELSSKALQAESPPACVFENGMTPIDQIKQGLKLEVQDLLYPKHVWIATVIENVGGRLLLRYHGFQESSHDFWLFYLSTRLHSIGWAKQANYFYHAPNVKPQGFEEQDIEKFLSQITAAESVPPELFSVDKNIPTHNFEVGMKMEMLSPVDQLHIVPVTVTKIIDDRYFLLKIDNFSETSNEEYCRHARSWDIFYPTWAKENGIKVQVPKGLNMMTNISRSLDWNEYLKHTNSQAADRKSFDLDQGNTDFPFSKGLRLEAVNPFQPHQLCAASITKVADHLMWIQLDSVDAFNVHHITSSKSYDIFPVGWCESNNYPLKPPRRWYSKRLRMLHAKKSHDGESLSIDQPISPIPASSSTDDNIVMFINHRCFSGRFLNKGKVSELPKSIGPGPVKLVMKEVISLLISAAYVPPRALKELQMVGKSSSNMSQCVIKAKYKNKSVRSSIKIAHHVSQIEECFNNISQALACCPYLFSLKCITDVCPKNCYKLTKTLFASSGPVTKKRKPYLHPNPVQMDNQKSATEKLKNLEGPQNKTKKYTTLIDHKMKSKVTDEGLVKEKQVPKAKNVSSDPSIDITLLKDMDIPKLASNPMLWTVEEVIQYFKNTSCANLIPFFRDEEIDGFALLMLNIVSVREYLKLKFGPAMKLCQHIEKLKISSYFHFPHE